MHHVAAGKLHTPALFQDPVKTGEEIHATLAKPANERARSVVAVIVNDVCSPLHDRLVSVGVDQDPGPAVEPTTAAIPQCVP